ncbi:MAG: hypothetical protein KGL39_02665 [Patescibacteria group bacterium]|nr:hypothetical protein [Patescibacteria group bacterium]
MMNGDDVPLRVGYYSPAEIAAANRRHDLKYGWSHMFPTVYFNASRLPETVVGDLHQHWQRRDQETWNHE